MRTEPYTPDEAELIGCYAGAMEEQAGENYATAKADAERGIAKIKADALRGQADHIGQHGASDGTVWYNVGTDHEDYAETAEYLRMEADRIEEDA